MSTKHLHSVNLQSLNKKGVLFNKNLQLRRICFEVFVKTVRIFKPNSYIDISKYTCHLPSTLVLGPKL